MQDTAARVSFERQLAISLFEIGENDAAEKHLSMARELLKCEMGKDDKSHAAQHLLPLLVERHRWAEVLEVIGHISTDFIRVVVPLLAEVAEQASAAGRADIARVALCRAREVADAQKASDRAELLAVLGAFAGQIGLHEMATNSFATALDAAEELKDSPRDLALTQIASKQFIGGEFEAGEANLRMIGSLSYTVRLMLSACRGRRSQRTSQHKTVSTGLCIRASRGIDHFGKCPAARRQFKARDRGRASSPRGCSADSIRAHTRGGRGKRGLNTARL